MRALLRRVPWEVRIVNGVLQQVMSMLSAATMSVVKGVLLRQQCQFCEWCAPAGVLATGNNVMRALPAALLLLL